MLPISNKSYKNIIDTCHFFKKINILFLLIIISLFTNPSIVKAQAKKNVIKKLSDSILTKKHSPKKATIYSMVLPGLGQAYNKKYWKIPIIYAGFGTLIYFINQNSNEYNKFKEAYKYVYDKDTVPTNNNYVTRYNLDELKTGKNYYRRNLEISYILTGALYILNIIDASVDANLFDYDISNDLSLKLEPFINNRYYFSKTTSGIKLTLNF